MEKKKKKASVSIISNYDGQLSPRATLDASLEDSGDWEELVMVYKIKGEPFEVLHQSFAGNIDYPKIQWMLQQALTTNSIECIRLQSIIDDQEGI